MKPKKVLSSFAPEIGGSAGPGTHGGNSVSRPDGMPTKAQSDYVVSDKSGFIDHVTKNDVTVYVDDDINLSGEYSIQVGSNVTIVAGFCDPNRTENNGRGPVIRQNYYNPQRYGQPTARTLVSRWGECPTLWGVSFQGPNTEYFDPRNRVDSSDWNSSDVKDWYATALFCYDEDTLKCYGCEFTGWTMAGVELGSRNHKTTGIFNRCSFHKNQMETLGYGVEQYAGKAEFDRCFFDNCRHGVSGFGYPDEDYTVRNSVVGPGPWCGHALDMHSLNNNLHNGDQTAGGKILIEDSTIMSTWDLGGYAQEGFAIRGIPDEEVRIRNCHFHHSEQPDETNVQGNAYRQETDSWTKFYVESNVFGENKDPGNAGAPRVVEKPADDDEDSESEKPEDQPSNKIMQLAIHGRGDAGRYTIRVNGKPKKTGNIESNDNINKLDNGDYEVTGGIVGATDTWELPEGTIPTAGEWTARCKVTLGGEDITGELAGVQLKTDVSSLADRVQTLEGKWESLTKAFSSIPG